MLAAQHIGGSIGLPANGVLNPSDNTVRWYKNGTWPMPGYPGPAVLVGHVSFGTKVVEKGVFWNLRNAAIGDTVRVGYTSKQAACFRITAVQTSSSKQALPAHQIWNATLKPELRLITCDQNSPVNNGHFADNVIVYADNLVTC